MYYHRDIPQDLGSFFIADAFHVKATCEKALENVKVARKQRLEKAIRDIWDQWYMSEKAWYAGFYRLIRLSKGVTMSAEELMRPDNKEFLNRLDKDLNASLFFTPYYWACRYAENAQETCERILSCCCSACTQLYVSSRDWDIISSWAGNGA